MFPSRIEVVRNLFVNSENVDDASGKDSRWTWQWDGQYIPSAWFCPSEFVLSDFNVGCNKSLECVSWRVLLMISEKSSNGDEEGEYEGTDDDVMWFAGSVHFSFYLGFLHLVISE